MILYFADRQLNIIGQASTKLPKGHTVIDDNRSEDVESGVSVFECKIPFDKDTRAEVETITELGNHIIMKDDDEDKLYTIIDAEIDTKAQQVYIYAEDDGMDLLNEVVGAYEADKAYNIAHYINMYAADAGFVIGINEVANLTRKLSWDGESTATARIASVATQFDGCEISFSFEVDGLNVVKKYINIYKERGKDIGVTLWLNKDIDRIVTTKSIANLATALRCTGATPDDDNTEDDIDPVPITLKGYSYDDGDFYVDSEGILKSRKALEKWSRFLWKTDESALSGGHIVKQYSYDTLEQKTLCSNAITELKKICDMEVNYEADISKFPDSVKIGDRINIVDTAGELYLSTRVLKLESSETNGERKATFGEHLIKTSGISQKVADLASQFAAQAAANKKARLEALRAAQQAEAEAEAARLAAEEAAQKAAQAEADLLAAQQAAEEAQRIADEAEAQAEAAARAAAQAEADAAESNAAVKIAQSAAETATTKAEEAKTKAETALSNATTAKTTADAAKLDAEKAKQDIASLGDELETVSQTMRADYARKTDLTEAEASLQSQITQNAGQISSAVSQISKINETANGAQEHAQAAQSAAEAAKSTADKATEDAQTAKTAADSAAQAATNAQAKADTAKAAADSAQKAADDADAKAVQAAADLAAAQQNLASVTSRVDATAEEVAAAQAAVVTAQAAADKAKADAATAQSTANTAKANAATAQTAANNAKTAADNAQAAADEAQQAADQAQAAVDALAVRVTTAETKITQNANQIALMATKTEVTQTLGGYYTKAQADAAIKVSADSITSSVRNTYATKNEVKAIEVGGRNLIVGSSNGIGWTQFDSFDAKTREFVRKTNNTGEVFIYCDNLFDLEAGQQYTISFDAKQSGTKDSGMDIYILPATFETTGIAYYNQSIRNLGTDYSHVVCTFTPNSAATSLKDCRLRFDNNGSATAGTDAFLYVKNVKLEKGNKATDWTPAPEDAENAIGQNKDQIDELQSTVSKTVEDVASLVLGASEITANVTRIEAATQESIDSLAEAHSALANQVSAKMTAEEVSIAIRSELSNGTHKVVTETGVTVDEAGLRVEKTGADTSTRISENGMTVSETATGETVLTANSSGVDAKNLHATTYMIVGKNSRFEDYGESRTGCFWIGG